MAKRFATSPPCCPCMDKANQEVWTAPPGSANKFKYKYEPQDKIRMDDFEARTYWMDAYEKCIKKCAKGGFKPGCKNCQRDPEKYTSGDKLLPPGTLRAACKTKEKKPGKDSTIIVLVWDMGQRPPRPLPAATVKLTEDIPSGPERKTNKNGRRVFQVEPGKYTIYAWKNDTGLVYPQGKRENVRVSAGQTVTVDIFLTPERPLTLYVYVRDWTKSRNLVSGARVFIGKARPKKENGEEDLTGDPIYSPGYRYSFTQRTESSGADRGRTVYRRLAHEKYMLRAEASFKFNVHRNEEKVGDLSTSSDRNIIDCRDKTKTWYDTQLMLKPLPKETRFSLKVVGGSWSSKGLKKYVVLLTLSIHVVITDLLTGKAAKYESTGAPMIAIGVSTPTIPLPVDGGSVKGKDGTITYFTAPTFVKGRLINETSFRGSASLGLTETTLVGKHLSIKFHHIPYPGTEATYNPILFPWPLKLVDIPVELEGLPNIPGAGTSKAYGVWHCKLNQV